MTPIEILKFNLQERQYPYFEDEEIDVLLETNDNDINKASWKGCLFKANADDAVNMGPLKTESNRGYWLGLAEQYKSDYERSLSGNRNNIGYKTSMRRVDGQ
ncbi:hypothetical protein FDB72_10395 [Clostridium botulinum]|uniref:hypothetical protein n=1 Tax=Clostridium botulinum TaxID=1491 RepID=UPI00059CCF47|nr:hypothetical protein [Clostridium botulinum]KIN80209.1 hypothetical protein SD74_16860 [Clostridium botulinum]MCC5426021.1 hypothetical protein [Clostridium botulinum]NFM46538.1 hypothetical protein [Clostridium botulinum]PSM00365.1 hypothetical protein C6C12_11545 [Clostridium botulinum]HDK7138936.1 hypothetical protein [Clostridium botulinum]